MEMGECNCYDDCISFYRSVQGKEQLFITAMAKSLEVIPRQLCENAGFDATNILNKLRQKHAEGKQIQYYRFAQKNVL